MIDRILQFIEYKDINKSIFYKETGLSNGFLDKVKDIGASKLELILKTYPEINFKWLLTGEGEMLKLEREVPVYMVQEEKSKYKTRGAPLIPIEAMAGFPDHDNIPVFEHQVRDVYVIPEFNGKVDYYIRVTGSSMYPKYNSGDIVACAKLEKLDFIQWNKTYVLDTSQGALVKRLIKDGDENIIICRSDNKEYPDFHIHRENINSIALIIGVIRFE